MIRTTLKYVLALLVLVLAFTCEGQALVLSQSTERVTASVVTEYNSVQSQPMKLLVKLNIKDGWHTYGDPAGEAAMPTKFEWNNSEVRLLTQSVSKKFEFMGFTQYGYDDVAYYEFEVPAYMSDFSLRVDWMACRNDECAPEMVMFSFDLYDMGSGIKEELWKKEYSNAVRSFIVKAEAHDLFVIILMAFVGGVVLNFMPCIFPILSIKAISLVQNINQHKKAKTEAVFYFIGVVVCFFIMASILILFRLKGEAIGWGFQLQSPMFVLLMIVIFFIIFLMLLDIVNLKNPFANKIGRISFARQKLNAFVTGFFAVLIASPCTAPFMGIAIGYTLTKPIYVYYPVFLALSVGYALPFTSIGFFPKLLSKVLPKPGKWMEVLKRLFAVPVFLTCMWLVWVLYAQLNSNVERKGYVVWEEFNQSEIDKDVALNEPVFINFTAKWCITCLVNEKMVLNSKGFKDIVDNRKIKLYKADWTLKDDDISNALASYDRNSIPLYVYCENKKCEVLPQLLTDDIVREGIKSVGDK